jgi:hypothetical protein
MGALIVILTPDAPDQEPRNGPTGSKPGPVQNEELASSVPVSGPDRNRRVPKSGPMVHGIGHLIGEIQMHLTIYGIHQGSYFLPLASQEEPGGQG